MFTIAVGGVRFMSHCACRSEKKVVILPIPIIENQHETEQITLHADGRVDGLLRNGSDQCRQY